MTRSSGKSSVTIVAPPNNTGTAGTWCRRAIKISLRTQSSGSSIGQVPISPSSHRSPYHNQQHSATDNPVHEKFLEITAERNGLVIQEDRFDPEPVRQFRVEERGGRGRVGAPAVDGHQSLGAVRTPRVDIHAIQRNTGRKPPGFVRKPYGVGRLPGATRSSRPSEPHFFLPPRFAGFFSGAAAASLYASTTWPGMRPRAASS